MFKKMFGSGDSKKEKEKEKEKEKKEKKERRREERREEERREEKKQQRKTSSDSAECTRSESKKERPRTKSASEDGAAKPRKTRPKPAGSKKRKNKVKREIKVDTSKPIEYPCVPEVILEYHKQKPFLKPNEEWLVVEMGEFECLVDNLEIVKIMAKHSKFFELDPPELLEEFFEFVDDVPSYDEVINYDVWQEFRDKRYPC